MSFYQQLQNKTTAERQSLLSSTAITRCREGDISREMYIEFLTQAYYHVSHTVPLLMCAGSRLPSSHESVRGAITEYIEEEYGHQEWILNDIRACGGDAEKVRLGTPSLPIEMMIAFLYYRIERVNPMSLFGMVLVLEGTSVSIASSIAAQVEQRLGLPKKATTYLRSHGELDQDHLKFFALLMDTITDKRDQDAIIHSARRVYHLYTQMLNQLGNNARESE
ncbi:MULTISPECIES: TenA family transcriptional regulator [Pectobacterium]|uniref:Biliverdin-producing heme oxygenase n=2 Tax=Pectobacterium TaxID=122277 RepID=A0AA93AMW5_9GAMM|nr:MULTISPECIES: iron-containing redox enzyme family protein [Pectobacterium]PLY39039.1 biliverdin-producing heme oxygenase [Pectobacterium carotovorum]MBA0171085.1 iron-containing redox enzyme family protein [Pectobacterium versatile]MBE5201128.1 iron-containing redox enzyme family protein [Pectobacterium quasiaquaticum]MBE5208687.1 iron-containing redox enzyme family protein [Pectobacterium quasiaquaticum]MBE5212263.1 iron-containing redox enzyme family protein [Pectobacterium quasiaquaticum